MALYALCTLFVTSSETTLPTPHAVDCYRCIQVHGTMHKPQIVHILLGYDNYISVELEK